MTPEKRATELVKRFDARSDYDMSGADRGWLCRNVVTAIYDALDEAAKIADDLKGRERDDLDVAEEIAHRIRALKAPSSLEGDQRTGPITEQE